MSASKRPPRPSASAPKLPTRRPRAAKPVEVADPNHPLPHDELYARILRYLRRFPNRANDLTPLADELGLPPSALQVEVERLARRGFVTLPFIEPGTGGGAELAQMGSAWLIAYEGGRPKDVPVALQLAKGRVRAEDESARLPRAEVYGRKS
ncbi:MAG TPA: helix-turn-helix domain-containing protein [Candidatus Limnocylindria bacterium]